MKVLITGGLGNIGQQVTTELVKHGFDVRVFDLENKKKLKNAKKMKNVEFFGVI